MSGLPTGLATISTRRRAPFHLAQCVYCLETVEFLDPETLADKSATTPAYRKLECADCGRRFLIEREARDLVHKSTVFTIQLPPETFASIFAFAAMKGPSPASTSSKNPLAPSTLVSRAWNLSSTPLLYRDIHIGEWDCRIKGSLLATLERHSTLLPHIRSFKTSYPRFTEWNDCLHEKSWSKLYNQSLEDQLGMLDADARALQEANLLAMGGLHAGAEADADKHCTAITQSEIDAASAGGWMDAGPPDGGYEAPRREGAVALVNFVGRCPRLTKLELERFDFGDVGDLVEPLAKTIPSSLPSITSLSLTNVTFPDPTNELVSRMPNLRELMLDEFSVMEDTPRQSLPQLWCLDLGRLHDGNVHAARVFLGTGHEALRSLSFIYEDFQFPVDRLLETVPTLEYLDIATSIQATLPLTDLLVFIKANTTLRFLAITTLLTSALVESLPTLITRLVVYTPWDSDDAASDALVGALEAIVISKRSRTPLLSKVLIHVSRFPSHSVTVRVVKAAAIASDVGVIFKFFTPIKARGMDHFFQDV